MSGDRARPQATNATVKLSPRTEPGQKTIISRPGETEGKEAILRPLPEVSLMDLFSGLRPLAAIDEKLKVDQARFELAASSMPMKRSSGLIYWPNNLFKEAWGGNPGADK